MYTAQETCMGVEECIFSDFITPYECPKLTTESRIFHKLPPREIGALAERETADSRAARGLGDPPNKLGCLRKQTTTRRGGGSIFGLPACLPP